MNGLLVLLGIAAAAAAGVAIYMRTKKKKAGARGRLQLAIAGMSLVVAVTSLVLAGGRGPQATPAQQRPTYAASTQNTTTTDAGNAEDSGNNGNVDSSDDTDSNNNNDVTVNGGDGSTICVMVEGGCIDPKTPVDEARERLALIPGAEKAPTGQGPWPFLILGTNEQGVYFRDGHTVEDRRLTGEPVVNDARPVYADCRVTNAWQADAAAPRTEALTTWLKVRYPEPGDQGDFWVYGGYAFPFGHDGNIPQCAD